MVAIRLAQIPLLAYIATLFAGTAMDFADASLPRRAQLRTEPPI